MIQSCTVSVELARNQIRFIYQQQKVQTEIYETQYARQSNMVINS